MKIINSRHIKEKDEYQQLNYNFDNKDIIPINWEVKNYSKEYGVDMFKDEEGRVVLRKKHANLTGSEENKTPHYHYFIAESIKHGSICDKCNEKRTKKVKCCGKLVNDFFVIDNCDEYSCCSYSDYCAKCYIINRLYWNISSAGNCYVCEKTGDFMVND